MKYPNILGGTLFLFLIVCMSCGAPIPDPDVGTLKCCQQGKLTDMECRGEQENCDQACSSSTNGTIHDRCDGNNEYQDRRTHGSRILKTVTKIGYNMEEITTQISNTPMCEVGGARRHGNDEECDNDENMDNDYDNRNSAVMPVTKHKILERAYELFDSQDRMDDSNKLSGDSEDSYSKEYQQSSALDTNIRMVIDGLVLDAGWFYETSREKLEVEIVMPAGQNCKKNIEMQVCSHNLPITMKKKCKTLMIMGENEVYTIDLKIDRGMINTIFVSYNGQDCQDGRGMTTIGVIHSDIIKRYDLRSMTIGHRPIEIQTKENPVHVAAIVLFILEAIILLAGILIVIFWIRSKNRKNGNPELGEHDESDTEPAQRDGGCDHCRLERSSNLEEINIDEMAEIMNLRFVGDRVKKVDARINIVKYWRETEL